MKNIIFFMVLMTVLLQLVGNSEYRKYVELFAGLVLIVVAVTPVLSFMGKADQFDLALEKYEFVSESRDLTAEFAAAEEKSKGMAAREYEQTLSDQMKAKLTEEGCAVGNVSVTVSRDEKDYGEIREVLVDFEDAGTDTMVPAIRVETIEIGEDKLTKTEGDEEGNEAFVQARKVLHKTYGIGEEQIRLKN
ncbi:stage III sporulation protein AF [Anaerolentibacter hominis]|uniref:stage III sporulation protein AF n=1 Tax=Anaerolentibacter hominis TaxID=3079009 RepID=UPI0031B81F05